MIFEPSWTLQIGEQTIEGSGVLGNRRPSDDLIDLFTVTINGTQVVVLPKEGRILQNLVTVFQGAPGKLIWGRIMQLIFGDGPKRQNCVCYRIGIDDGVRKGFRLFNDGRLEEGLD